MSVLKLLLSFLSLATVGTTTTVVPPDIDPPPTIEINVEKPAGAPTTPKATTASANTPEIAQCLADKGAKFYGAFWCPHCHDQKEMFGDAMEYIEYIECDARGENANPEACLAADITSYPTWVFADGEKLVGARTPEELAEKASCL